jgi:poly(hydroxyalkanoate) depolymerase family esterase
MNFQAEAGEFLVVYPEQDVVANHARCWNWFEPADQRRDQGEPALIAGITRQVMREYRVEASRVYVAGLSAGGAMAAVVAAAYPELYAAVGVHSGLAAGSAHDLPSAFQAMQHGGPAGRTSVGRAIPLIIFHGDHDKTVHPSNAEQLVEQWVAAAGAGDRPRVTTQQGRADGGRTFSRALIQGARGNTLVERWTIHGAGHAWSGGRRGGSYTDPKGPDASAEMLRFFHEHPRA